MPAESLERLIEIVREAGRIALDARQGMTRELKPDGSIVTNGDLQVEQFLRGQLTHLVPGSRVFGEEFGHEGDSDAGLWAVDPIDGTSNYAFGSPLWGVSVGLIVGDHVELGVVFLPAIDEMYAAAVGRPSTCNGQTLPAIPPGDIKPEELVSYNDTLFTLFPEIEWPGKMRYSGAFVVDAMWVVQQRFRALVGVKGRVYDIAASALIAQQLGAQVVYADGSPLSFGDLKDGKRIPKPYTFLPGGAKPPLVGLT